MGLFDKMRRADFDFNYADARTMALRTRPDTLIMERMSYGWRFREGWALAPPCEMWYDPDIQDNA